jgi:hypothetical protein
MTTAVQDFRDTPAFKRLLKDREHIREDLNEFNRQYGQFITMETASISTVLKCHLIVEHFLDEYLAAANPSLGPIEKCRLTFAQKLELANHPRGALRLLLPGLRELNTIRNALSHRLQVEVSTDKMKAMFALMKPWKAEEGEPAPKGLGLIREFSLLSSSILFGTTAMIKRHTPNGGLVGLAQWYQTED